MTSSKTRLVTALAAAVVVALPAVPAQAHDDEPGTTDSMHLTRKERLTVLNATRRFTDPAAAVAAGYIPTDVCVDLPGVGGMGYHYVNPQYASDGVVDPVHPDVLVYIQAKDHTRTLGAVEYFQADADQDLSTDGDRPSLFGKYAFEGPMLGHEPGMPIHYDKHVWLFKRNPSGQLAPWNPNVHCPASS